MKFNHIYLILPAVLLLASVSPASGQNLDPTVEVSRDYEGKLMEVHKPKIAMAVPDSVLRFDLEFDYSVSDSPYKGAYEFSPYTMDMKPSPTIRDFGKFYMKAGAGYQLHPVFDLIWSPEFKKPFRMNVYGSHRSFIGNYWTMNEPGLSGEEAVVDRMRQEDGGKRFWKGYDLLTDAGIDGRYDWSGGLLRFDIGYYGLFQQDNLFHVTARSYNALDASIGMSSKDSPGDLFRYRAAVSYRLAGDELSDTSAEPKSLGEQNLKLDGGLLFGLSNGGMFGFDLGLKLASTSGDFVSGGGEFDVVPKYVMDSGRWHFDIGARISAAFRTDPFSEVYEYEEQMLYPAIRVEYMAISDAMKLYLDLGGDSKVESYADVISHNHRADLRYGRGRWDILNITDESLSAVIGAEGRAGVRFSYDVRGGYVSYANAMLDGIIARKATAVTSATWLPALGYTAYDKAFAEIDWLLQLDSFRFDGNFCYAYAWSRSRESSNGLFLPAAFTGNVALEYDWKKRCTFAVGCEFSTARKGNVTDLGGNTVEAAVPGYADLGVDVEYDINRRFSVWARGGNLLGMTVQRSILYAEKGPYFTAGICLNL